MNKKGSFFRVNALVFPHFDLGRVLGCFRNQDIQSKRKPLARAFISSPRDLLKRSRCDYLPSYRVEALSEVEDGPAEVSLRDPHAHGRGAGISRQSRQGLLAPPQAELRVRV